VAKTSASEASLSTHYGIRLTTTTESCTARDAGIFLDIPAENPRQKERIGQITAIEDFFGAGFEIPLATFDCF
jgi:hypothetical protein